MYHAVLYGDQMVCIQEFYFQSDLIQIISSSSHVQDLLTCVVNAVFPCVTAESKFKILLF